MLKRLEEIVTYYNQEVFAKPQYSLTANDDKVIILGYEGDICSGLLLEVTALAYAHHRYVTVRAQEGKPYLEITF